MADLFIMAESLGWHKSPWYPASPLGNVRDEGWLYRLHKAVDGAYEDSCYEAFNVAGTSRWRVYRGDELVYRSSSLSDCQSWVQAQVLYADDKEASDGC